MAGVVRPMSFPSRITEAPEGVEVMTSLPFLGAMAFRRVDIFCGFSEVRFTTCSKSSKSGFDRVMRRSRFRGRLSRVAGVVRPVSLPSSIMAAPAGSVMMFKTPMGFARASFISMRFVEVTSMDFSSGVKSFISARMV